MADEIKSNADDLTKEYCALVLEACGVEHPTKDQLAIAKANTAAQFKARVCSDNPSVVHDAMKELNNLRFRVKEAKVPKDLVNSDAVHAVRVALEGGESASTVATPEQAAKDAEAERRKNDPEWYSRPVEAGSGDARGQSKSPDDKLGDERPAKPTHDKAVEEHDAKKAHARDAKHADDCKKHK